MAWVAGLLFLISGCSTFGVRPVLSDSFEERPEPMPEVLCSETVVAPVLDTVGAVPLLAAAIALFADHPTSNAILGNAEHQKQFENEVAGVSAVLGVALAASATYGFHQTNRCRRAHEGQRLDGFVGPRALPGHSPSAEAPHGADAPRAAVDLRPTLARVSVP